MRLPKTISGATLLATLAVAGCGSSGSHAPIIPIAFKSPAVTGSSLPSTYTCDGKNVSPPIEWGAVPAGTGELVLFVLGVTENPSTNSYAVSVEWAVSGIDPNLHKLAMGEVPHGAHIGVSNTNGTNYSVCPKKGPKVKYQFELYGLPASQAIPPEFEDLPVYSTLSTSNHSSPADSHGAFLTDYKQRH